MLSQVHSVTHFHELRKHGYRSAVWMRDPYERVGSMFTGTYHVGGPQPGAMSFEHFVDSWLPDAAKPKVREWSAMHPSLGKPATVHGNEHFLPQVQVCNFGLPSVHPEAPTWDYVGTSGANDTDTFARVNAFGERVFGSATYQRAAKHGWCECSNQWSTAKCTTDTFFQPHTNKGSSNLQALPEAVVQRIRRKIYELYTEDVTFVSDWRGIRPLSKIFTTPSPACARLPYVQAVA